MFPLKRQTRTYGRAEQPKIERVDHRVCSRGDAVMSDDLSQLSQDLAIHSSSRSNGAKQDGS
jgi:hypothetical protein